MSSLTFLAIVASLVITLHSVSGEDFLKKYLTVMEEGIKCHKGVKTLAPKLKESAETCAKRKEITAYSCFVICVYREFGYFRKDENGYLLLDYGMVAVLTQQMFDLTTPTGRDEYFWFGRDSYDCAKDHLEPKKFKTLESLDNKEKCDQGNDFFHCVHRSLTCGVTMFGQ